MSNLFVLFYLLGYIYLPNLLIQIPNFSVIILFGYFNRLTYERTEKNVRGPSGNAFEEKRYGWVIRINGFNYIPGKKQKLSK